MAGRFFEDLEIGEKIRHSMGRTITEYDNVLFSSMTMNTQPLHLNADFAKKSEFGRPIVNGMLSMALTVGISVSELTEGTIVANLDYEHVRHPHPLFHGDTLYVESEVIEKRESRTRPHCGIVKVRHIGRNQEGTIVIELVRNVLFLKREAPPG